MPVRENKFARRAREKREELKGSAPGDAPAPVGAPRRRIEEADRAAPVAPEKDAREGRPDDGDDLFPL